MGKKAKENQIKFECGQCHQVNYFSRKNKKLLKQRLELAKWCKHCRQHTKHKETK